MTNQAVPFSYFDCLLPPLLVLMVPSGVSGGRNGELLGKKSANKKIPVCEDPTLKFIRMHALLIVVDWKSRCSVYMSLITSDAAS